VALLEGSNQDKIQTLKSLLKDSETGLQGVDEMQTLLNYFNSGFTLQQAEIIIDLSLARGLNYYTGTILEVKARDFAYGSIGGGGRYDDLTGIFGLPGVPGVGISFGADRIYDILNELNLFPNEALNTSEVLIANFSAEELTPCLYLVQELRTASIPAEIFPEAGKLKKQFDYAEKKGIPFLMIYGATEAEGGIVNVKELSSGRQVTVPRAEISSFRSYFNL
jgi:histidyl-tRNA synthetase